MPNLKKYFYATLLPWGQTLATSIVAGCLMALGAIKLGHEEVFNFTSEWNTAITLKLAAWGAFLGLLQHIMKSPIPVPTFNDKEIAEESNEKDETKEQEGAEQQDIVEEVKPAPRTKPSRATKKKPTRKPAAKKPK
jgi:hypothetical protein